MEDQKAKLSQAFIHCLWKKPDGGIEKAMDLISSLDPNFDCAVGPGLFHQACLFGTRDLVAKLIERGVDINGIYAQKWTPLHMAVMGNNHDVVALLLEKKAIVYRSTYVLAADRGLHAIAELLLSTLRSEHRSSQDKLRGVTPTEDPSPRLG